MLNLPTVRQLRYFVALEEHGHFGRAAEACFVSQSAFSVAIRELESLLGVRLVDRTNRSVTVSALGREVATQARLCIRDLESLVEGVDIGDPESIESRTVTFLQRIPIDPFTEEAEWGLRSYQDDFDSKNWGGENVYDVYSLSELRALDGTYYKEW